MSANSVPTSEVMGDGATPGVEGDLRLFASEAGAFSESLAADLRGRVSEAMVAVVEVNVHHGSGGCRA